MDTLGRVEWTHGDVLSGHSHHTPHTPQPTTTTTRPQHHTETETEREKIEKKSQRQREKRRRKRRRQDKRREKIHFQCGGASVLCWWSAFSGQSRLSARLVLVKQCQVRFIFDFSASWPVNSSLISANNLIYAVTVFNFIFLIFLVLQLQFRKNF